MDDDGNMTAPMLAILLVLAGIAVVVGVLIGNTVL